MASASGRFHLSFNGEIYNFLDLRTDLESAGYRFRGHSDTEVMLAAFEQWSVEEAVKRFVGMFAFALWDRRERVLYLCRDRLGEKPLYYGWVNGCFLFGSELKALRAHPRWVGEIDRDALALFMRHSYVPAPHSIYKGIRKVLPGTILVIPLASLDRQPDIKELTYWSATQAAEAGIASPFRGTDQDAIEYLEQLLRDCIKSQMVADVPLGAFLSGGVDSSTVVALMQSASNRPVRTFTMGFSEDDYNEAVHAKAVAKHLGTDHTELYVSPAEAMAVIPKLPSMYDEPFSDSSQIPTFLVSELARRHVTVSLSGDGGDELFCGYQRYELGQAMWSRLRRLPRGLRRAVAKGLKAIPVSTWNALPGVTIPALSRYGRPGRLGDKLYKLAETFEVRTSGEVYKQLVSHWKQPSSIVLNSQEPLTALTDPDRRPSISDFSSWMMCIDAISYLPDDILVKVDRAAMATSLESRVPFLDHRVVEFAWKLPLSMKVRNGQSKWLLRQLLYKYVPKTLIERPKMGFGVPIDSWLRGPLRDWAESLIDERRIRQEGFLHPEPIHEKWSEHLSGSRNWQYYLWDVLMFQAWLEHTNAHSSLETAFFVPPAREGLAQKETYA